MYDYIIVTHIPVFYKINLYNELARKMNILVVFISSNTNETRSDDFITLSNSKFQYRLLFDGNLQDRGVNRNITNLKKILNHNQYRKLIVGGWDLVEYWYLIWTNNKMRNCLILESTINESRVDGVKGFMKKIFLRRISTVFASGNLHKKLLDALNYKGETRITKGVGIINKPKLNPMKRKYKKRFLFIGRLSKEKNIEMLINLFNDLEDYQLTIIGTGPLEKILMSKAKDNITFKGQVVNHKLKECFDANDLLILTSTSEPWGLVVEEALYFGIPVMISSNCGASVLINEGMNGYIFDFNQIERIKDIIISLNDEVYTKLLAGVRKFSINEKDIKQLGVYFAN
jgi:glycosyltransferase involved in cell wall biosynthesis